MKYTITDLAMSKNFQGLYAGSPRPEAKQRMKDIMLKRIEHLHPDIESYDDFTGDFERKLIKMGKAEVSTYGNIVLAIVDFKEDPDKERDADWANANILFIYYPNHGETLNSKLDKILKEEEYTTYGCWF